MRARGRGHGAPGGEFLRQGGRARRPTSRRASSSPTSPRSSAATRSAPRRSPRRTSPPTPKAPRKRAARRLFVLQYVQPGLAGLIDGSVSTLAPLFAAAFATHSNWETFLVGLAASIGAGISMGFTEALSDNGEHHRPRLALDARPRLRADDRARRPRPHPALSRAGRLAERLLRRHRDRRASWSRSSSSRSRWIRTHYMETPFCSATCR